MGLTNRLQTFSNELVQGQDTAHLQPDFLNNGLKTTPPKNNFNHFKQLLKGAYQPLWIMHILKIVNAGS